jgi:hypothetical protein
MSTKIPISSTGPAEIALVAIESCLSGLRWTQGARNFLRFGMSCLAKHSTTPSSQFSNQLISTAICDLKSRKQSATLRYKMRPAVFLQFV